MSRRFERRPAGRVDEDDLTETRERLSAALGGSDALLSALHLHSKVSVTDAAGLIIDVNENFCRLCGYSRDELLGKTHAILNSGVHSAAFWAAMWERISAGQPWRGEICNRSKDGSFTWLDCMIAPILGEDGSPAIYIAIRNDISESKRTEAKLAQERERMVSLLAKLQEANARFEVASEAAGIAIWEYDLAAESLAWDDRMHTIYGIARGSEPLRYQQWVDAVHPKDRASATAAIDRAIRGDGHLDGAFRVVRPNGEVRHLRTAGRLLRDTNGRATRVTGVDVDVTASIRAEMQLFKTSSILRNVLDSAAEVSIIATDPNLIVQVFNVGAEHLLGYSSDEVVDRLTPARFHDRAELRDLCETAGTEYGRSLDGWEVFVQPEMLGRARECTILRRDGTALRMSQVVNAMFTYEGELIGYLSIGHDVTKQRDYQQSLREATSRAEQANRAKSEFLANMSHEIRTPMNAVIGLSYLLRNTALDEKQSGFLANIETASKSLLAIINDVLDLSKIEAGELLVEKTAFCPRDLVNEVVGVMRLHADAKRIEFRTQMPADLPAMLDGDPTRVKQILTNLLSNAIRFTDHGAVEVRVAVDGDAAAAVGLCFTVKDTGIGIAPAAQARLFMPFAQADASITRRYGGTGLGLSIVKSLVMVLGGTIELESTAGVGSTFTVRLRFPRTAGGAPAADAPQAPIPGHVGLPGVRVLVVDDSAMNLDVVKYILELEGAEVALARNGQEALDRLQADSTEFDVVLMDVQMPVMDGHAATRLIRRDLGLVDLPIIALTAGALSSERDRAVGAGMDDFLIKPFEPASLVRCIRKHVNAASVVAGTVVARAAAPQAAHSEWPEIDGIDSADAKSRLSNDCGLFFSSLARLLVEFPAIAMPGGAGEPGGLTELAAQMHKLKGNAGTLGANALQALAAEAEAACLANDVDHVANLVASVATHLARLRDSAAPVITAARARTEAVDAAAAPPTKELSLDLVDELIHLMRQQNLAALDRFRGIAPQLRHLLGSAAFEAARAHMDSLQFNQAATILQAAAIVLAA